MLFNVHTNQWDDELLALLRHSARADARGACRRARRLRPTRDADLLGSAIAIGGVAGDQQSALFGQACFAAGMAKNTYGTGCFMLMHTGERIPDLDTTACSTTSAAQTGAAAASSRWKAACSSAAPWCSGCATACAPSRRSSEVQALAESVPDAGGVMMVPAFTGLGAPYWKPEARGTITGLTRGTTLAHIARAALESIAYQSAALLQAMSRDAVAAGGAPVAELRVDGGACVNDLLMQFQADLLGIPVVRPERHRDHGAGRGLPGGAVERRLREHRRAGAAVARRAALPARPWTRRRREERDGALGTRGAPGHARIGRRRPPSRSARAATMGASFADLPP